MLLLHGTRYRECVLRPCAIASAHVPMTETPRPHLDKRDEVGIWLDGAVVVLDPGGGLLKHNTVCLEKLAKPGEGRVRVCLGGPS